MTHILLDEAIIPVETEHGDIHISTGTGPSGPRVVIIGAGPEHVDVHLTVAQTLELIRQLLSAISRIPRRRGEAA